MSSHTKLELFCSGAMGRPAWFAALQPQCTNARLSCLWPPTSPQQGWDPAWTQWNEDTIRERLLACGFALWFIDKQGTPHPSFQKELQIGRALWSEGALRGMAYIDVMRPSYVAHNAPSSASAAISLAIQCMPGASRGVIVPSNLPSYLASRWFPLMKEANDDNPETSEDTPETVDADLDDVASQASPTSDSDERDA